MVRQLLTLRRDKIAPLLGSIAFDAGALRCAEPLLAVAWTLADGRRLWLLANLSDAPAARPADWKTGPPIWGGEPKEELPPWSVFWSIG